MLFGCGMLTLVVWLAGSHVGAAPLPTAEFDVPYKLRVLSNGTVLELSGSFSWALPQNVQAILAGAPGVRVVRLESPGGHVLPALQIATIIQQRGLDTYVGRTLAPRVRCSLLSGGRQRWLASDARLGFHQARTRAVGVPPEQANAFLQAAYEKFAVPSPFVAHVLRTPPADLWYPTQQDLRAAHYTTGDPPASVLSLGRSPLPRLSDFTRLLRTAPDDAVIQFATAFSDLIGQLQETNPEACWTFAHEGPDDPQDVLPQTVLDGFAAAQQRLAEAARTTQAAALDPAQRKQAEADLLAAMRAKGQLASLEGLRSGADHAAFCPSLGDLLQAALGLPDTHRGTALRLAVLSGRVTAGVAQSRATRSIAGDWPQRLAAAGVVFTSPALAEDASNDPLRAMRSRGFALTREVECSIRRPGLLACHWHGRKRP